MQRYERLGKVRKCNSRNGKIDKVEIEQDYLEIEPDQVEIEKLDRDRNILSLDR